MPFDHRLLVAFDHAPLGLLAGSTSIKQTARAMHSASHAGLVVNFGLCRQLVAEGTDRGDLIMRLDGNQTYRYGDWTVLPDWELLYHPADAALIGAQGAAVNLILGGPAELPSIKVVARAAAGCAAAGLSLVVSAISIDPPDTHAELRLEHQLAAVRMACELGADAVVCYGAGDPAVIRAARQWCYVGLYAQGVPAAIDRSELANWVTDCMEAGADGVCVGRAIWAKMDAAAVAAELSKAMLTRDSRGKGLA